MIYILWAHPDQHFYRQELKNTPLKNIYLPLLLRAEKKKENLLPNASLFFKSPLLLPKLKLISEVLSP